MTKADIYNLSGKVVSKIELPKEALDFKSNPDLIHQAVVVHLSNNRRSTANTKTRAEVSGSGRKPWRQKGTGRARAGDIRPPHWIGGGIAHGPRSNRNWLKGFPQKMRRKAMLLVLSDKIKSGKVIILDKLVFKSHKTKEALKMLEALPINEGSILVALAKNNPEVELAFGNLPYAKTINASSLNTYEILKHDWLIMDFDALNKISKIWLKKDLSTPVSIVQKKTVSKRARSK